MREILFRAQRVDNNEWVEGSLVTTNHLGLRCYILKDIGGISIQVIPETIGQFTGLINHKGEKVFDGDIVQFSDEDEKSTHVIKWDDSLYRWYDQRLEDGASGVDFYEFEAFEDAHIIGNIHQNQELL